MMLLIALFLFLSACPATEPAPQRADHFLTRAEAKQRLESRTIP